METETRFDTGEIRKAEITPEGYLRAEAVFARDGILEYRQPDGNVRKELRTPEENRKALTSFGLKGLTIEHPPVLLDSNNSKTFAVGMSDSTVVYDQGGFVRGVITSFDSQAIGFVQSGEKVEISAGYQCELDETPGVWRGQHYDAIQKNIAVNHIALTAKGRAGSDVRVCLDSSDIEVISAPKTTKKQMVKISLDSIEYPDVPEGFAQAAAAKFKELDKIQTQLDSLQSSVEELSLERDRAYGRADGFEEIVDSATPLLQKLGYKWDADENNFVKADGKPLPWEEEADDEDEEEEEETPPPPKGKKKKTAKKSDSATALDWFAAEELVPGIRTKFDSALTTTDIRKMVISEFLPEMDLNNRTDSYIEGVFESLQLDSDDEEEEEAVEAETEAEGDEDEDEDEERTDSYVDELSTAIRATRGDGKNCKDGSLSESDKRRMDGYKRPLGMSKMS